MRKVISKTRLKQLGYKSVRAAAAAAGVPRSTFYGWIIEGRQPRDPKKIETIRRRLIKKAPKIIERKKIPRAGEMASITALASAIGAAELSFGKLTEGKINEIAGKVFLDSGTISRSESIGDVRSHFSDFYLAHGLDNASFQVAGQNFFDSFKKTDSGLSQYTQSFIDELIFFFSTLFPKLRGLRIYPPFVKPDSSEIESLRAGGLFSTANPMHFLQALNYASDIPRQYFGVFFIKQSEIETEIQFFKGSWE